METKPVITCLKTLLIICPFIFWITAVILLAVGVWGKLTLGTYISLTAENSTNAPYVLIGTGTTIVISGYLDALPLAVPLMLKLYAMFLPLSLSLACKAVCFVMRSRTLSSGLTQMPCRITIAMMRGAGQWTMCSAA